MHTHLFWGGYFVTLILVELVFFAILCFLFYYPKIVFLRRNLYSVSNQNTMLQIKEWHTSTSFDPWWHCFPIGSPLTQHCRWRTSSLPITVLTEVIGRCWAISQQNRGRTHSAPWRRGTRFQIWRKNSPLTQSSPVQPSIPFWALFFFANQLWESFCE